MQFTRKIALDIVRGFVEYLLFFPIILLIGTFLLPKEAIMLWLPIVFGVFSFGIMVKNILPVNWSIYPLLAIIIGIIPSYMLAENLIFLFLLIILHSRSEEHTSELQSRENLVCRLLLEKKKGPRNRFSTVLDPASAHI